MYFIELIVKKVLNRKNKNKKESVFNFEESVEKTETCKEHIFLPVDSSGDVLACINCGLVVRKSDLHKQNPF